MGRKVVTDFNYQGDQSGQRLDSVENENEEIHPSINNTVIENAQKKSRFHVVESNFQKFQVLEMVREGIQVKQTRGSGKCFQDFQRL